MMFPRAITRTHSDGLRNIFYLFVEVQDTEPHLDEWRSQPVYGMSAAWEFYLFVRLFFVAIF